MSKCEKCQHEFPDHLVSAMAIGVDGKLKYINVCPICGLKTQNEIHGMNRKNFSPGTTAQSMLEQARAFLKRKNDGKQEG